MTHSRFLPILVPILLAPAVAFAMNVDELLQKAEVADKHVSYRGMKVARFLFAGDDVSAKFKVVHRRPGQTRTEYYSPDALAGMMVIQDGPKFWKYCPKEDLWRESSCTSSFSLDAIHQEALENYDLRLVGSDYVAGRPTYVIQAVPRSRFDSPRRVWVDKDYYLIMCSQVESPQGTVINSSKFVTIEINPDNISPSVFKVKGKVVQARKPGNLRSGIIKPAYLPKGYRLVGVSSVSVDNRCSAHLQFSNGISVISLFERKSEKDLPPRSVKSKVTKVLTWAQNGVQFTLMGDVPFSELHKIADSTR